jgi:hypothetical protein
LDEKGCGRIDKRGKLLCEPDGILLRGQILPRHLRAVRPVPVVALFAEWHKQGVPETIVLTKSLSRSDRVALRSGKKRSTTNNNTRTVTAMNGVGRFFISE